MNSIQPQMAGHDVTNRVRLRLQPDRVSSVVSRKTCAVSLARHSDGSTGDAGLEFSRKLVRVGQGVPVVLAVPAGWPCLPAR